MIAKILSAQSSSGSVLDYNEKKCFEGNASVVHVENLEGNDTATIYDTFEAYETNPAIVEQVRKKSFHMTLGPGAGENLTDEECVSLIKEMMTELGYGQQPYVIYKHFDIDREHYHIVSTRIDKNGKRIEQFKEGKRLNNLMKELAPKYGYTVGATVASKLPVVPKKEFSPKGANVLGTLQALFEDALKYDFHSFYQFQCVMAAMNVKVTLRKRKDGGNNVILQGLDDNGKRASRLYSLEKHLGYQGAEQYEKRLKENNDMGYLQMDRKIVVREIADYCMERTKSAEEYCAALEEAGIRHILSRDPKTMEIKRLTLVEKSTYTLVDTAVRGELYLRPLVESERTGLWSTPSARMKKISSIAKVRKKGGARFFTDERVRELQDIITVAVAKHHEGNTVQVNNGLGQGPTLRLK